MSRHMDADSEFHRRRAEVEMERALAAGHPDVAQRHLELARVHRERRDAIATLWRQAGQGSPPPITRIDKEA
jgi:hypothetical protein